MYKKINAPDADHNFHRWLGPIPSLSKAEIRLSQLRAELGNVEGKRQFIRELHSEKAGGWL